VTDILTLSQPAGWKLHRLGQLFEERKEKVSDKDFPPLSVTMGGIVPQLDTAAKSDDSDNRKLVRRGDYAINSRSDRKGSGGVSELDGSVSLITIVLKPRGILPRFAHHLLRSTAFQEEFYRWGHGIVADLWTTRFADMKNIRIFLPDLPTQKSIADFLDRETARIDQLIEKKRRFLKLLGQKRAGVISQAVTKGLDSASPVKNSGVDWIGAIPAHWRMMKLGYLGTCANGINIGGDAFGSGFPFVSYGDVYKNRELPNQVEGLVQSNNDDRIRYSVKAGDVLFTRTSETMEEIGFSSVCARTIENAVFAGFLIRFRPSGARLEPRFSKFTFQNSGIREYFAKEMRLVTRASLSQGLLQKMPIALPPIEEQRAIADFLERIDRKIAFIMAKTENSIALLTELRAALVTAAATGQIDVTTWGKQGQMGHRLDRIEEAMRA